MRLLQLARSTAGRLVFPFKKSTRVTLIVQQLIWLQSFEAWFYLFERYEPIIPVGFTSDQSYFELYDQLVVILVTQLITLPTVGDISLCSAGPRRMPFHNFCMAVNHCSRCQYWQLVCYSSLFCTLWITIPMVSHLPRAYYTLW